MRISYAVGTFGANRPYSSLGEALKDAEMNGDDILKILTVPHGRYFIRYDTVIVSFGRHAVRRYMCKPSIEIIKPFEKRR